MRQVQLHKAMLMQEVQQLKSANVPKIGKRQFYTVLDDETL